MRRIERCACLKLTAIRMLVEGLIMIGQVLSTRARREKISPRGDDGPWMRQQHPACTGELGKIHLRIEPSGCSQTARLLDVVYSLRVMLGPNPDQQVIHRGIRHRIEHWFARDRINTLPELWFIHQVNSIWEWQRRVKEKMFQWTSSRGREPGFGIHSTFFTISAATRIGNGSRQSFKHAMFLLLEW